MYVFTPVDNDLLSSSINDTQLSNVCKVEIADKNKLDI